MCVEDVYLQIINDNEPYLFFHTSIHQSRDDIVSEWDIAKVIPSVYINILYCFYGA